MDNLSNPQQQKTITYHTEDAVSENDKRLVWGVVVHKKWGEGVVEEIKGDKVKIRFSINEPAKLFKYPMVFESIVSFKDPELSKIAQNLCAASKPVVSKPATPPKTFQDGKELLKAMPRNAYKVKQEDDTDRSLSRTVSASYIPDERFNSIHDIQAFNNMFLPALRAEIAYLKDSGGKRIKLFDGKYIDSISGEYYYTFEVDSEPTFPEGTPISIYYNGKIDGMVVFCEDLTVTISCGVKFPDKLAVLEISADPWMLLDALIKKLEELGADVPEIVEELISQGKQNIVSSSIVKGQDNAVKTAANQPITFIWGPPGTGKTETLAKIALKAIKEDQRVLMLSYSNISVDGAVKRVWRMAEKQKAGFKLGCILRYGYPRDPDVKSTPGLTTRDYVVKKSPVLDKQIKSILNSLQNTKKATKGYIALQKQLNELRKQLKAEEANAIQKAMFVATTVSKAVVDGAVNGQTFDVVIFDEASMAYIPQIVLSASLAKQHFVCMGDFKQLPPIVQNSDDSPLCSDMFDYAGITQAVESGKGHNWLCLLDTQYRMHPDIASFVSDNMYHSLLKTASNLLPEKLEVCKYAPIKGRSLGFVDLSGMLSVCSKTADGSKINVLSAMIAFGMALSAAKQYEVGIITPYAAQARLLRSMISDAAASIPNKITAATVHQFQGSEKKVIIFDAVECYRQPYIGPLLSSKKRNTANRLFNVAMTRAEGKFVALANVWYFKEKRFSKDMLFRRLIDKFALSGAVTADKIPVELSGLSGAFKCMSEESSEKTFIEDLKKANDAIRIDVPGKLKKDRYDELFSVLKDAVNRYVTVIIRAEDIDLIPEDLKKFAVSNLYVTNPVTIIDKKIVWYGKPNSRAVFKVEGKGVACRIRPVIRMEGKHVANALFGFLEMNRSQEQTAGAAASGERFLDYAKGKKKCGKCGKPMKIRSSFKGVFWGCTGYPNCENIEQVAPEFVNQYILKNQIRCRHDGSWVKAYVENGKLVVRCLDPSQHKIDITKV